jgi:hypothetical protein
MLAAGLELPGAPLSRALALGRAQLHHLRYGVPDLLACKAAGRAVLRHQSAPREFLIGHTDLG